MYNTLTVAELKKLAKVKGHSGYSRLKKNELISLLNGNTKPLVKKSVKKSAKPLVKKSVKKSAKTPAKKSAKKSAKKTAKKTVKKTAETPAKKTVKKMVKSAGKSVVMKSIDELKLIHREMQKPSFIVNMYSYIEMEYTHPIYPKTVYMIGEYHSYEKCDKKIQSPIDQEDMIRTIQHTSDQLVDIFVESHFPSKIDKDIGYIPNLSGSVSRTCIDSIAYTRRNPQYGA